ncbi:MAG TPA: hypothetical protein VGL56_02475 [Fimbriimonadaceae bacterium]
MPGLIGFIVIIAIMGLLIDAARVFGGSLLGSPDGAWLIEGKPDTINVYGAHAFLKTNSAWATVHNGKFVKWAWQGSGQINVVVSKGAAVKTWTEKGGGIWFHITEQ